MKVGFIGIGTMGKLLVEAFISSGALLPENIVASNRTYSKALALADEFPGLAAVASNNEVVEKSDIVFLCMKPLEFIQVVQEIKQTLKPEQIAVSITSPVLISHLEEELNCKIAKVIPSITNTICSGASLCMYGKRMQQTDRERLNNLLGFISEPLQISESFTRIVSDISSCGPAFFAFLLQQFIDAAVSETGIHREEAVQVASNMLLGTGLLLTQGGLSPEQIQQRVAVPGGITAKALRLLQKDSEGMFERLIRTTHDKYYDDLSKVAIAFYSEEVNEP